MGSLHFYVFGSSMFFFYDFFYGINAKNEVFPFHTWAVWRVQLNRLFNQTAEWKTKWKCSNNDVKGTNLFYRGFMDFVVTAMGLCVDEVLLTGCGRHGGTFLHVIACIPLQGQEVFESEHCQELQVTWSSFLTLSPAKAGPWDCPAPGIAWPLRCLSVSLWPCLSRLNHPGFHSLEDTLREVPYFHSLKIGWGYVSA